MRFSYLAIFLTALCFSCEDAFETTLEIDLPQPPDVIQFSSFVYYDPFRPQVCRVGRISALDEDLFETNLLNDATVELIALDRNESLFFEFLGNENSSFNYFINMDESWFEGNQDYELRIEHPDYPTASATQRLREATPIDEVRFFADAGLDEEGDESSGIEITFADGPDMDHYEISLHTAVFFEDRVVLTDYIDISSTDPSTSYGVSSISLLVEDITFNGEEKTILIKFDRHYSEMQEELYVLMKSVSEDHYRHAKTARLADDADDNPFQTPVQIHSNGENGVGIFSMYSQTGRFVVE